MRSAVGTIGPLKKAGPTIETLKEKMKKIRNRNSFFCIFFLQNVIDNFKYAATYEVTYNVLKQFFLNKFNTKKKLYEK